VSEATPILVLDRVTKHFGGLTAVADVSFTVPAGELLGIIGPNGAGKTSLFNVLTGIYDADGGTFNFDGEPLDRLKPNQVAERGIASSRMTLRRSVSARAARARKPEEPSTISFNPATRGARARCCSRDLKKAHPAAAWNRTII